jgi:cobalamin biosynthesis protein CobD/CbiB
MFAKKLGILAIALIIDQTLGEPPTSLHPVVWIGRLVAACVAAGVGARSDVRRG